MPTVLQLSKAQYRLQDFLINKTIDLNFEDNSTILGYVGRISYRKGIVKIINVLSRLLKITNL